MVMACASFNHVVLSPMNNSSYLGGPFAKGISSIEICRSRKMQSSRKAKRKRMSIRSRRESDDAGDYPWESSNHYLQWVEEDTITFFTSDGLIRLGGSAVRRRLDISNEKSGSFHPSQKFHEEDYMDPHQGLCLGAIFDISATNDANSACFGFCRSIDMLSDVVEDTVLEQGGEVLVAEKESKSGLNERLIMNVVVPFLWGVPPAADRLHIAVRSGGGIVDKIYWQWNFV